jgi:hypothetical protein
MLLHQWFQANDVQGSHSHVAVVHRPSVYLFRDTDDGGTSSEQYHFGVAHLVGRAVGKVEAEGCERPSVNGRS